MLRLVGHWPSLRDEPEDLATFHLHSVGEYQQYVLEIIRMRSELLAVADYMAHYHVLTHSSQHLRDYMAHYHVRIINTSPQPDAKSELTQEFSIRNSSSATRSQQL